MEESASDENIKVVVRIRDLIAREKGQPKVRSPPDLTKSNFLLFRLSKFWTPPTSFRRAARRAGHLTESTMLWRITS